MHAHSATSPRSTAQPARDVAGPTRGTPPAEREVRLADCQTYRVHTSAIGAAAAS